MYKRRRTSSVASRPDNDDDAGPEATPTTTKEADVVTTTTTTRKKKKLDPSEQCQHLYDSIRNAKKEDGSMLCDTFIRVPKRRQEPSYYELVSNPIDLLRIQTKLKMDLYADPDELTTDIELLVNNAKAFYKPDSDEYADANQLLETFLQNKQKITDGILHAEEAAAETKRPVRVGRKPRTSVADTDDASEGSKEDDNDLYEELFASIMTATDPNDNRFLHTEFQLLPSKRLYPDYYEVIEHPIDLKLIASKIQTSAYTSLGEMEKDLLQMVKNACMFNEPGSQIYKDAKTLKKSFIARKVEIESGKYKPTRPKRRGTTYSGMVAVLKEEAESSDDEDDMDTEGSGPMWQLFDQIYNTANSSGAPLGESLWKLPNRRFHPDYYAQIKKPISMTQIRNKLKKGLYANVIEMSTDLYQMIDNAKKAYPGTHKIHKDAVKMQKVLSQKLVDAGNSQDDSDEDDDNASVESSPATPVPRKKGRPRIHPIATPSTPLSMSTPAAKGRGPLNPALKKKMLEISKFLVHQVNHGRPTMVPFMERPSAKLYPTYYEVIEHPMDMNTIMANIMGDKYETLDEVVGDFRLMFENCRTFNEEESDIVDDANILEKLLNGKIKELSAHNMGKTPGKMMKGGAGRKSLTSMQSKAKQLHDAVRDYKDAKTGRLLSTVFMKLPSKNDYPDYYDIIKNPVDMEKISNKIKQQGYETLDELAADFMTMFENACKYNEPDSQIYKDALILQQLVIQKKQSLRETNDDSVPDTQLAVQELLLSLFTTLYNHQDEEGLCFSDSLAELPEYDEVDGTKNRGISLDLIKRRLDKGLYKRLDTFQEDVFSCLDRARRLSRTDSQVFEDSIELQGFFIRKRDELCKNGEILNSPALSYTTMHLSAAVEAVRQSKLLQEEQEHEAEAEMTTTVNGESMEIDQKVYSPGDFVYYESPEMKILGVVYIERLWTNAENVKMMYGNVFLRPHETYHITTRKFLEQELFKSDMYQTIPLSQVRNKCQVLFIKDYLKYQVDGLPEKDVYVCESRYNSKGRSFKKIKNWPVAKLPSVKLVQRATPLEPKRVMSVFKERVEKHKGELAELLLQEALVEKEKPNVPMMVVGGEEGCTYYEQYNTVCSGVVKTGDFVYVAAEGEKQLIAHINMIWETKEGDCFFRGPTLLYPSEVSLIGTRSAYRQEVFLSSASHDAISMFTVVGRCCVLEYAAYTHLRPTEIPESDVYICEYVYDEAKKQLRKGQSLADGGLMKKFVHSQLVTPDEIYYYKRTILPQTSVPPAAEDWNSGDLMAIMEDSMDGGHSSVGSDSMPLLNASPSTNVKKFKFKKQVITGYILYSREVRKSFVQSNPDATFGDISRLVGNEWRSLPQNERQVWEEKATKLNEENTKRLEEMGCLSPTPFANYELVTNQVFECAWDKCDWQFEDPADWCEHSVADPTGHVQTHSTNADSLVCLWRGCVRVKKQAPPFPNLVRLVKHVREVHINKCNGKIIQPADRSKNYMPSKKLVQNANIGTLPLNTTSQNQMGKGPQYPNINSQSIVPATIQIIQAPPQSVEPMFVICPPRPQRVLHSKAYLNYMEGYRNDRRFITPWEKTIKAKEDTTPAVDTANLPLNWIGYKDQTKPEEVVSALWKLRDFMMKDVLTIPRHEY